MDPFVITILMSNFRELIFAEFAFISEFLRSERYDDFVIQYFEYIIF